MGLATRTTSCLWRLLVVKLALWWQGSMTNIVMIGWIIFISSSRCIRRSIMMLFEACSAIPSRLFTIIIRGCDISTEHCSVVG